MTTTIARVKRGSVRDGSNATCANCGSMLHRATVRHPWEHWPARRGADPIECTPRLDRYPRFRIGTDVYVLRLDGTIDDSAVGSVTDSFIQNGLTYYYVHWDDEADDAKPDWFLQSELVQANYVGLQVRLERALLDSGMIPDGDDDDATALFAAAKALQNKTGSGIAGLWGEILSAEGY